MKKPGLKFPKRSKEGSAPSPASVPQTVEEWVEKGASEEESGDRWIGSDLSKGLRFFQLANLSYNKAVALASTSSLATGSLDSYYNASRLLFHVYNNYTKQDGVNFSQLENVEDAVYGSTPVVQPLFNIVKAHETAIGKAQSLNVPIPLDLLYNTALVYTEQIESAQENEMPLDQVLAITSKAEEIFENVLQQQTNILQKFLEDLKGGEDDAEEEYSQQAPGAGSEEEEQFESEESLQPSDIYETVLSSYKLVQATLENITHPDQIVATTQLVKPFLDNIGTIENELVATFSQSNNKNELIESISNEQVGESKITKTFIEGLLFNNLNELVQLWSSDDLPVTPERYMSASDNIQAFLDRNDITVEIQNHRANETDSSEYTNVLWQALTKMNNSYKLAQDLLQAKLQEKRTVSASQQDNGLGELISQISAIIIARADIDLQRYQFANYEPAAKSQSVLLSNCKNFLKNATNIANQSGGLRERVTEKKLREKRKVEAVLRLCLIEGKISIEELDTIVGRVRWVHELPALVNLGYFKRFGIESINIPHDLD